MKKFRETKVGAWCVEHKKGLKIASIVAGVITGGGALGYVGWKIGYREGCDLVGKLAETAGEEASEAINAAAEEIADAVCEAV